MTHGLTGAMAMCLVGVAASVLAQNFLRDNTGSGPST
jgi:hypothetical protein